MVSGKCPKCGSGSLKYQSCEHEDMSIRYPFECKNCGFIGNEWYDLEFSGFTDDEGNECE
jgi:predicted nucleic-acid-binding Zn-ribbon protein